MPFTHHRGNGRRIAFRTRGKSAQSLDAGSGKTDPGAGGDGRLFLQIRPAIADPRTLGPRSQTTLTGDYSKDESRTETLNLQAVGEGKVQLCRTAQEKDRLPDRISLDRRGLSTIPHIVGEPGLRLLSLQHNLINSLTGIASLDLGKLVFLDIYDNQIDKISSMERLFSLRVLLMGKNRSDTSWFGSLTAATALPPVLFNMDNWQKVDTVNATRIRRIEGLTSVMKLEVLDLHGNRIGKVCGLSTLADLKVLNLAGNQIKNIGLADLQGLVSLRELNLKRNRLRKLMGFQHTPKLQKLYLGNNDLQSVEDMSSLAEATNLVDVSLDGNPVALGGDCAPFLVSYLPNLLTLTNMNVTEQVRRAAMAWRKNKEAAHAAYCALGGTAQQGARRDQVIHNARTNWELLRSETKCFAAAIAATSKQGDLEQEFILEASTAVVTQSGTQTIDIGVLPDVVISLQRSDTAEESEKNIEYKKESTASKSPRATQNRKLHRSNTAKKLSEKRVNFSDRSASQDTDGSHSTSTSSELRLPPILLPIISTLENVKLTDQCEPLLKRWESISSVEPIVDSSFSSMPSSSSDTEDEAYKKQLRRVPTVLRRRANFSSMRSRSVCDPETRKIKGNIKSSDNSENASNMSTSTNVGSVATSSTSSSDQNNKSLRRDSSVNSRLSNRNIRSATTSRRTERASSANRASTARVKPVKNLASFKSSEPVPKPIPLVKDREQGVDYLVEICDNVVSAWGAGAVRRLSRDWDWERARRVTRASFHYVHFNAVAQALPDLKSKFPNVTYISVRATGLQWFGQLHSLAELRGLTGLSIIAEGNPIFNKSWREYVIYRLAHWGLKEVNEEPVTEEEIKVANETYNGLSDLVLSALPDAPLQPLLTRLGRNGHSALSAKAWLRAADPALRDVIAKEALQFKKTTISQEDMSWRVKGRSQLALAIELACGAAQRLRSLEIQWPSILVEMIEDCLRDFTDMENHVKEQMQMLIESL